MNHSHILTINLLDTYESLNMQATQQFIIGAAAGIKQTHQFVRNIITLMGNDPNVPLVCDSSFGKLDDKIKYWLGMDSETREKALVSIVLPTKTPFVHQVKPENLEIKKLREELQKSYESRRGQEMLLLAKEAYIKQLEDRAPINRHMVYDFDEVDAMKDLQMLKVYTKNIIINYELIIKENEKLNSENFENKRLKQEALYIISGHKTLEEFEAATPDPTINYEKKKRNLIEIGMVIDDEKNKMVKFRAVCKKETLISLESEFKVKLDNITKLNETLLSENLTLKSLLEKETLENNDLKQIMSSKSETDQKHLDIILEKEVLKRIQEKKEKKKEKNTKRRQRLTAIQKKRVSDEIPPLLQDNNSSKQQVMVSSENKSQLFKDGKLIISGALNWNKNEASEAMLFFMNKVMDNEILRNRALQQNQFKAKLNSLLNKIKNLNKNMIMEFLDIASLNSKIVYNMGN